MLLLSSAFTSVVRLSGICLREMQVFDCYRFLLALENLGCGTVNFVSLPMVQFVTTWEVRYLLAFLGGTVKKIGKLIVDRIIE